LQNYGVINFVPFFLDHPVHNACVALFMHHPVSCVCSYGCQLSSRVTVCFAAVFAWYAGQCNQTVVGSKHRLWGGPKEDSESWQPCS